MGLCRGQKISERLWRRHRRAVLTIYFDPARTYGTARIENLPGNPQGYFTHILVRNTGKDTAKACCARLMSISRIEGEAEARAHEFPTSRVLKWANESFEPIEIAPGLPEARRCDLAYGIEGAPMVQFFLRDVEPGSGVQSAYPAGRYRARVRVNSTNAKHADATFDINFTGIWNQITVTQVE